MSDTDSLDMLAKEFRAWAKKVEEKLPKNPERLKAFINTSGIPIERLYTPLDFKDGDYLSVLGFPGSFPFTRVGWPKKRGLSKRIGVEGSA